MSTELSFCHFHRFWSRNYRNYIAGNVIAQRLFADSCFAGPWRVLEYLNNCIVTVFFIGYQVFYFLASTMSLPLTELLLPSFHILLFSAHSQRYIQTLFLKRKFHALPFLFGSPVECCVCSVQYIYKFFHICDFWKMICSFQIKLQHEPFIVWKVSEPFFAFLLLPPYVFFPPLWFLVRQQNYSSSKKPFLYFGDSIFYWLQRGKNIIFIDIYGYFIYISSHIIICSDGLVCPCSSAGRAQPW